MNPTSIAPSSISDLAFRSLRNPLITPENVRPSRKDFVVECVLNPGAFVFQNRIGLVFRIAERSIQEKGWISTPVMSPDADGGIEILRFRLDDPEVDASDPRLIRYQGATYLTTLSHLRLAWSRDGENFHIEDKPLPLGHNALASFGVEDCRVSRLGETYCLTYTAVSRFGHAVGFARTQDWLNFNEEGLILPHPNKDCAIFEEKIGGQYWMLHRPTSTDFSAHSIWSATSDDLVHWGDHRCVATPRRGSWDSARVGAGAAPIATDEGWLEIYHGATPDHRYCLGLMLLDRNDPTKVLARSAEPIMQPVEMYEEKGFLGGVIFTNGHVVDGDTVKVYYGAADRIVCRADFSIKALLQSLR